MLKMTGDDDMPEREGHEAATYGTVLTYDAPHVLEDTWGVKGPDGTMLESVVRFELATNDDGSVTLLLAHRGVMPGFESRTLGGWHALLDALHARLAGREPRPMTNAFREIEARYREAEHAAR